MLLLLAAGINLVVFGIGCGAFWLGVRYMVTDLEAVKKTRLDEFSPGDVEYFQELRKWENGVQ